MKILIFGIPGSGKTHLAHKISDALKIPIFHIDKHFFEKGWIERDHDHFLSDVRSVLETDHWIIDGNGMRTLEMRYKEAGIAIYCRLPRWICLYRIFYRWISTANVPKKDGPEGSTNSVSWKLIKYLWKFTGRYEEKIDELAKKYPKIQLIKIQSKDQMQCLERDCQEILKPD